MYSIYNLTNRELRAYCIRFVYIKYYTYICTELKNK